MLHCARSGALLAEQLHGRLEKVHVQAQDAIESSQCPPGIGALVTVVSDQAANHGSVLFFDVGLIILPIGTRGRERYPLLFTVTQLFIVDELAAVIGVQAEKGKWQALPYAMDRTADVRFAEARTSLAF